MTNDQDRSVAVVLAAHGDRGGEGDNKHLANHAAALEENGNFAGVFWGVLNGKPTIEDALKEADACGADQVVVYPVFMSAGYFVKTVLSDRISAAGMKTPTGIMQPLGLDKRLALLMLEHALRATKAANVDPGEARLLIVGHGSKNGPESAEATNRAAGLLSEHSPYASIDTAFIDEEPLLADSLTEYDGTSVVAGFLAGDGMHGGEDVPNAIKDTGARALFTGPIGMHPRVPELILSAISRAIEEQGHLEASAAASPSPTAVRAGPEDAVASTIETPAADPEPKPAKADKKRTRRRAGPLRLLFKAAFVLVMMAVLAIGAVTFLVPEDAIREQVAAAVKQKTGRTLTIGGNTSFSLVPNVGVELEDVAISNPPGMADGETLRIKVLNVNLKLLPLLTKRVEIDRFVLERPVFNLVVDQQGRKNWDFSKKTAVLDSNKSGSRLAAAERTRPHMIMAQAGGLGGGAVKDISLGTVKVTNGIVNYSDEVTGVRHSVKAMNVTVVQPDLSDPLQVEGDLVWQGEKVSFDARLEDVPALLRDKSSGAAFVLTTQHWTGDFKGNLAAAPSLTVNGAINGKTPSVRGLVDWLGNPLPPGGGLGPMSITGNLGLAGETITISKMQLSIDGMNGSGEMKVRASGVRPHITASLNLDKLDLNPYVQGQATSAEAPAPTREARPQPAPEAKQQEQQGQGQSLTDFIKKLDKDKPAPQVRAWSQEALNYAGLRAVDADLNLSAQAIYFRNIKTGASQVDADIKSGVLTAKLTRLSLYSGSGTGQVQLNGARAVPAMTATFNLNGIAALPLLKDASDFKWISGRSNIALNVSGSGRSQTEMMRSLQGQGNFQFTDGAIEGINLPAMVRGLKQGKFDGWKQGSREKTDFSQLSASFNIQRGVASNQDLNMVGPLIRMTGEGTVDIGNERLDYSALPRIVASLEGQGAQVDQNRGIAVPVKINGSWEDPKVKVDLERMLNDPELAQNAINEVGKALEKDGELNNILKGLLGGGNQQGGADGGGQGQQANPGDILKNLFKKP